MMKLIIGLGHPAHFHLFKEIISYFNTNQTRILVIILNKDNLETLLKNSGISYVKLLDKKQSNKPIVKFQEYLRASSKFKKIVKEFDPDLIIGCINQISNLKWWRKIPSIFFAEDDFKVTYLQGLMVYPTVTNILTPSVTNVGPFKLKQIVYNSYHELSYLHPSNFIPDKSIVQHLYGTRKGYFLLRFSSLKAYHDSGNKGFNNELALKLINILEPYGNVYISSEKKLTYELSKYQIGINPIHMHHVINFADLLISDSQTMTAEAAVLGIPTVRFNSFVGRLSYLEELQDKYGLTFGFKPEESEKMLAKVNELLNHTKLNEDWSRKRQMMLTDKINLAAFMVWFIENYPESVKVMKDNPDYQYRFK